MSYSVKMAKLKYKFNPYTYARVSAMKSLLLQRADYDRLMKMDPSEIIKFLQEGVYSKEINDAAIRYSGLKLIEIALNRHLARIFQKLRMISDPNVEFLLDQYLKRYDYYNLKTLIRAKVTRVSEEEFMDIVLPAGSLKMERLKELFQKDSVRQIIDSSGLIQVREFSDAISRFEQTNELSEIENLFDYHYYNDTMAFSENIPKEGKLFREFFKYEFDVHNIKLILKKVFFGLGEDYIRKYIVYGGKHLSKNIINSMLKKTDFKEFSNELRRTRYSGLLDNLGNPEKPLLELEIVLERLLLQESILLYHQHPLTVDVVLGYMFAKEIEARNLRVIIKSKKLEFTEDYVKKLIIVK